MGRGSCVLSIGSLSDGGAISRRAMVFLCTEYPKVTCHSQGQRCQRSLEGLPSCPLPCHSLLARELVQRHPPVARMLASLAPQHCSSRIVFSMKDYQHSSGLVGYREDSGGVLLSRSMCLVRSTTGINTSHGLVRDHIQQESLLTKWTLTLNFTLTPPH